MTGREFCSSLPLDLHANVSLDAEYLYIPGKHPHTGHPFGSHMGVAVGIIWDQRGKAHMGSSCALHGFHATPRCTPHLGPRCDTYASTHKYPTFTPSVSPMSPALYLVQAPQSRLTWGSTMGAPRQLTRTDDRQCFTGYQTMCADL